MSCGFLAKELKSDSSQIQELRTLTATCSSGPASYPQPCDLALDFTHPDAQNTKAAYLQL